MLQHAVLRCACVMQWLLIQRQEAQFKAAELEFHQEQLQHVSEEQRQAEEQIHVSLEGGNDLANGGQNLLKCQISCAITLTLTWQSVHVHCWPYVLVKASGEALGSRACMCLAILAYSNKSNTTYIVHVCISNTTYNSMTVG